MKTKLLITLFISIIATQMSFAHALWIETSSNGSLNKKHTVKVFYGEYAEQAIDPVDKWYSDVKDFDLYLISPSGTKTKLDKKSNIDHFESEFIPSENGTYTLSIVHGAKEPYETMRFEFSSVAFVTVGKGQATSTKAPFHLKPNNSNPKVGNDLEISVLNDGLGQKETEVIIMGPEGWTKTVHSDENGKISFKPLAVGKYIIEASKTEDKAEEWDGKKIEKIWRGSTLAIQVK